MPKDSKGHGSDPANLFHEGQSVRFSGTATDRSFIGSAPVTVRNPWSNRHLVTQSRGGQHYEGAHKHIPTATVEYDRSKRGLSNVRFDAFHHDLSASE